MFDDLMELSQRFLKIKNTPYERYLMVDFNSHLLSFLLGNRGVGKTTMLIQKLLKNVSGDIFSEKILYVQTDHFQVGSRTLYEIAENFFSHGGKWIVFDEIHKYSEWPKELKSIYDTFPKLQVLASGSSALEIYKGSHDLSRRAIKYNLSGLSFREFFLPNLDNPKN